MITGVTAETIRVPLPRPWGPDVPANHLVVARLDLDDGRIATGFSWTPSVGAGAVQAMINDDVRGAVRGMPSHPGVVWDRLWRRMHEAGPGITAMAMAAVDIALWDAKASGAGHGLVDELGRRRDEVPAYGSGVNRHYPLDELVAQVRRQRAAGHAAVKIKVGRADLADDVARVAAVREAIGARAGLAIDANQRWDLPRARRAIDAMARYDLSWVEEPLAADDIDGHRRLRAGITVPIAVGENLRTVHAFRDWLAAGACDIVQPNVVRIGGITPFLRVAELAALYDVPAYPHLLPDLSGQLACALPLPAWVEEVEDASFAHLGVLAGPSPVTIERGILRVTPHHGHGLRFREVAR